RLRHPVTFRHAESSRRAEPSAAARPLLTRPSTGAPPAVAASLPLPPLLARPLLSRPGPTPALALLSRTALHCPTASADTAVTATTTAPTAGQGAALREWYARRGRSGGAGPCTYVLHTGSRRGEECGLPHTTQRYFGRLTDDWRAQFPDAVELPHWHDLLLQNVPMFDLDFDAIHAAMYALTDSAEGDCYLSVPPDPGIAAAALGASASAAPDTGESAAPGAGESALSGTAPTEAFHTFTLDSGASGSFFRDSTTLTPLSRPVAVSLADPSGGPVLAHSSTVLPCPAAPSGLLSGLHLPLFSTNLGSGADIQDAWVDQFAPGGQRVTNCTCSRTGRHLTTFTHPPVSSLYTLTTAPPPVSSSGQVAASSQVFAAASRSSPAYGLLYPFLGSTPLPPPLPPVPAPTCVPCVEGRQRAAPHSSSFPPNEAPLQTLHVDVWGRARVCGQGHERYFLLVVDDYSHYTTVFPLRRKGEVPETFSLPASPQQNGIAERRIGMVMDVARTSMIHAAAPHFLWPFAVQYAAHQINLQPRVSLPETTPTLWFSYLLCGDFVIHPELSLLCLTGLVFLLVPNSFASSFIPVSSQVMRPRSVSGDLELLSAILQRTSCPPVPFPVSSLASLLTHPGGKFYHPTSRRVLSSQDVTFDESMSYYRLFPYRTASLPPPAALPSTRYSP
ncbi:unnamed protein product, partial [Closterium sp. NIES-54]